MKVFRWKHRNLAKFIKIWSTYCWCHSVLLVPEFLLVYKLQVVHFLKSTVIELALTLGLVYLKLKQYLKLLNKNHDKIFLYHFKVLYVQGAGAFFFRFVEDILIFFGCFLLFGRYFILSLWRNPHFHSLFFHKKSTKYWNQIHKRK